MRRSALDSVLCYNFVIYSVNMHANKRHTGKYRPLYGREDTFRVGYFLQIPIGNDVIYILLISKYSFGRR